MSNQIQFVLNAVIKGVFEGFTEFLPISSTGHLVLIRHWFPLAENPGDVERLNNIFDIVVQFPAVLAIVILYWSRLWRSAIGLPDRPDARRFWTGLVLAFIPAAILGVLLKKTIEMQLMKDVPIALALIVGGLILILVERRPRTGEIDNAERTPLRTAFAIGLFQCFALVPGTSRSGATIIGGRLCGQNRMAAAEFSFFLALPTMFGAFVYQLFESRHDIHWATDGTILLAGGIASFITAAIVVALFIRFLQRHSLSVFGIYRILLGVIVLYAVAMRG